MKEFRSISDKKVTTACLPECDRSYGVIGTVAVTVSSVHSPFPARAAKGPQRRQKQNDFGVEVERSITNSCRGGCSRDGEGASPDPALPTCPAVDGRTMGHVWCGYTPTRKPTAARQRSQVAGPDHHELCRLGHRTCHP